MKIFVVPTFRREYPGRPKAQDYSCPADRYAL